jgi:hypothetical protein
MRASQTGAKPWGSDEADRANAYLAACGIHRGRGKGGADRHARWSTVIRADGHRMWWRLA